MTVYTSGTADLLRQVIGVLCIALHNMNGPVYKAVFRLNDRLGEWKSERLTTANY